MMKNKRICLGYVIFILSVLFISSCSLTNGMIFKRIIGQNVRGVMIPEPDSGISGTPMAVKKTDDDSGIDTELLDFLRLKNAKPVKAKTAHVRKETDPEQENPESEKRDIDVSERALVKVVRSVPDLAVAKPEQPSGSLRKRRTEISGPDLSLTRDPIRDMSIWPEHIPMSSGGPTQTCNPETSDFEERETPDAPEDLKDHVPARKSPAERAFYSAHSKKLGIALDGTENKSLIRTVAQWLGVPFKWGGCSKKGVDCSCFVKLIYEKVYGIVLSRTSRSIFHNDLFYVKKRELQEGDILSFKMKGDQISHIGIYLKKNKFVHATRSKGVMLNSLTQRYYKKRFYMAGRVSEIPDVMMAEKDSQKSGKSVKLNTLVVMETAKKKASPPTSSLISLSADNHSLASL